VSLPWSPMSISMIPVEPGKNCPNTSVQLGLPGSRVGDGAGTVAANAVLSGGLADAASARPSVSSSASHARAHHEFHTTEIPFVTMSLRP
jgi:hypothetical protein